jgi:predicted RNA-binding Zn-ribbon protein involved in translation (DUF1610 family)
MTHIRISQAGACPRRLQLEAWGDQEIKTGTLTQCPNCGKEFVISRAQEWRYKAGKVKKLY